MLSISSRTKKFIEDSKDLIELGDWKALYDKSEQNSSLDTCELTECLYKARIDPLEGMTSIPSFFLEGSNLFTKFEVPEGIESIEFQAFYGALMTEVKLPESLYNIGREAFAATKNISSIILPENCIGLDEGAFRKSALQKIDLTHITSVGRECFQGCESLEEVIIGPRITALSDSIFADCPKLKTLTLPKSLNRISSWTLDNAQIRKLVIENPDINIGADAFSNVEIGLVVFRGTTKQWLESVPESPLRRVMCSDGLITQ